MKSKQSLLQLHNWPSTHTDAHYFIPLTQSFLFVFETPCALRSGIAVWSASLAGCCSRSVPLHQ
jgi:hypothetical protein